MRPGLLAERLDHVRDQPVLPPALALGIDAGAHDHQVVPGDHGDELPLVARRW